MEMIRVENLTKSFKNVEVVHVPSLHIAAGHSVGLAGNNGAGKTTLFRLLLDLLEPSTGTAFLKGKQVKGSDEWKYFTGSFLDDSFLIDFLTPNEYFDYVGSLHHLAKAEVKSRVEQYADFFAGEVLGVKKYIRDLSMGNRKKVGIVAALLAKPELLILDEPFSNLDPSSVIRLKRLLNDYRSDAQKTVIISSHDLSHVVEVCDRMLIMEKGSIIHDGPVNDSTLGELQAYFDTGSLAEVAQHHGSAAAGEHPAAEGEAESI